MADDIQVGLALSGGGYRAMLFSLGSLWRLNELGWLRKIDMITSVSGGSILNGILATHWSQLQWKDADDNREVASNFAEVIARPVREVAATAIDLRAGLEGILSVFSSISDKVAERYDDVVFHGARLQSHVPDFEKGKVPRFLFYATSLQTGSSVRIERKRLADYKIGEIPNPDLPVAKVVAASSAFPPFLSPVVLELDPHAWRSLDGAFLRDRADLKRTLYLADGGVYDNMGLEAIWDRCPTVLVSDAGAPFEVQAAPATDWVRQAMRTLDIVVEQTRALRKRSLIGEFQRSREQSSASATATKAAQKSGAYWGIKTSIDSFGLPDALVKDSTVSRGLQEIRTRLDAFTDQEQGRLINWGYALADAAMRKWAGAKPVTSGTLPVATAPL